MVRDGIGLTRSEIDSRRLRKKSSRIQIRDRSGFTGC